MASVGDATSSKRSRVKTERMQEFEKSQEDNVTQKLLKCPKDGCDKVFTSVPGLRYHTKTHVEPNRRFICDKCHKSFKSANGLKYHRGKTKGCDVSSSDNQLEKIDKSSGEDTDDSAAEDSISQEMSADDEAHNCHHHHHHQHHHHHHHHHPQQQQQPQFYVNDKSREACDSAVNSVSVTETKDESFKTKPIPLLLSPSSSSSPSTTATTPADEKPNVVVTHSSNSTTTCSSSTSTCWSLMNDDNNCTSDVNKLQQLAIIATGPESPLLKPEKIIQHKHFCSDGSDPQVTSSSPCPTSTKETSKESATWSHTWPTTVWQCFMKGVQIQFPENSWQTAEELARIEQLRKSSSGKENSQDGLDFTPSDSSAVLALSNMAKQRRDLEQENLEKRLQEKKAKKPNAILKTDSLKAKRPMNGFMLFAKKNRLEYTQMYPGKDNRAISVMLGDRWKQMKTEERSVFAEEAKHLAEQQKRIHPDCWKRKAVKS